MTAVRVTRQSSTHYKFGYVYIIHAPCKECGAQAEGRVAPSKKDGDLSTRLAEEWADSLRAGREHLTCGKCNSAKEKARMAASDKRWAEHTAKNK